MTAEVAQPLLQRQCGSCELCCRLLPVLSLGKEAGKRCIHQRGVLHTKGPGCAVHHDPRAGFPSECGQWDCRWLVDPSLDAPRPDLAHYVVDIIPDFILARDDRDLPGDEPRKQPVIQIWCDPSYPDAHRDPALRAWLETQDGYAALVRYDNIDAIFLIPPRLSSCGTWEEVGGGRMTQQGTMHSAEEIAGVLHNAGIMPE